MKKILRNCDVIIRVSDIVAAHIPNGEPNIVEVCTHYPLANFRFVCESNRAAKDYLNSLQREMEE